MDAWGRRALVCAVVVLGCLVVVGVGVAVAADAGSGESEPSSTLAVADEPPVSSTVGPALLQENDEPDGDADADEPDDNGDADEPDDNGDADENGGADDGETPDDESPADNATAFNDTVNADLAAADEIYVRFDVHEDRSATVTVDYRYRLGENNESAVDWPALTDRLNASPEAYVAVEAERWQRTVDRGVNETDREMTLSAFEVTTDESSTPMAIGHVRYTFEWSSFAYGEPQYMEVGDALSDFTLVEGTRLTITWPNQYNATLIEPAPTTRDAAAAHWDGAEIAFDEPRIELIENGGGSDDGGTEIVWGISWQVGAAIGALATALAISLGAVAWLLRRDHADESAAPATTAVGSSGATGTVTDRESALLTNEEQVLDLLERRGGRLKQQQVVAELDWTEAKTSQVVGTLRDDDEIDVFRMGRENVLVHSADEE